MADHRRVRLGWRCVLVGVLLAYVGVNACVQPGLQPFNMSAVGNVASHLLIWRARSTWRPAIDNWGVEPNGGGWVAHDESVPVTAPGSVKVTRDRRMYRRGVWSITSEVMHDDVTFTHAQSGQTAVLSPDQRKAILGAIDALEPGWFPQGRLAYYAAGGSITRRVVWLGVANDVSVLVALTIAIVLGIKGIVEWSRRSRRGCAECGYDTRGLEASGRCSECGAEIREATRKGCC